MQKATDKNIYLYHTKVLNNRPSIIISIQNYKDFVLILNFLKKNNKTYNVYFVIKNPSTHLIQSLKLIFQEITGTKINDKNVVEIANNCKFAFFLNKSFDNIFIDIISSKYKYIFISNALVIDCCRLYPNYNNLFGTPDDMFDDVINILNTDTGFINPSSKFIYKGFVFNLTTDNKIYRFVKTPHKLINAENMIHTTKINNVYNCEQLELYEAEKIPFVTFYPEWSRLQKIDAIKIILKLNCNLLKDGYYLHDPHRTNISFMHCAPKYIDCDSAVKYNDFFSCIKMFNYYLELTISGILNSENAIDFDKNFKTSKDIINKIYTEGYTIDCVNNLYGQLINQLDNYKFSNIENCWINYCDPKSTTYEDFVNDAKTNIRTKFILDNLVKYKPKTVIDLGCNSGYYSIMAESTGAIVLGVDCIDEVVDKAYSINKKLNKKITYAKIDLSNIKEINNALSIYDRFNAEFGIASALSHHLYRIGMNFDKQAEMFSKFCSKYLFVEFIPNEDIHVAQWKFPEAYNLNNYIAALSKYFNIIEVGESMPFPRKCIICSRNNYTK